MLGLLLLQFRSLTITTMAAALSPLLWANGSGAEIMRRVAAPMIGGLVTSAFLTLEVIPVLYTMWRVHQLRKAQRTSVPLAQIIGAAPPWAQRRPEGLAGAAVSIVGRPAKGLSSRAVNTEAET